MIRKIKLYRIRFLRREYTMEFGHAPIGCFALAFAVSALVTYFTCLFATLIIRG